MIQKIHFERKIPQNINGKIDKKLIKETLNNEFIRSSASPSPLKNIFSFI